MVPASVNNYIQQQPLPRLTQSDTNRTRGILSRNTRQEPPSASLAIKSEPQWNGPVNSPSANTEVVSTTSLVNTSNEVNFGTGVDGLMKAIQAKSKNTTPQTTSLVDQTSSRQGDKKRHQCRTCPKSFHQKTHLDIHERAHTGVKPYPCKEPGCGRSFSQGGNLRTHERRHSGERPYACNICWKRFAQSGGIRAHMVVHNKSKPFLCRLDECDQRCTTLGNLKLHQNRFHSDTIRTLTTKFASIKDGDIVKASEKKAWEYFANLYKNSNKGIKGRGKDSKIGHSGSGGASSMGTCDDDIPLAFGERIY
ncbi:uncharacterized protein K444DRAFT_538372 [Hyaloscypha bicolor E]|uniref:C2H2-type domain-containing protein n=1 Tax=Hyaloscypha bicolor E TaxID=1095630 RepID=A0A2J6SX52_9HELO|nr:uncharacterized protein K444DRAFT_538372 [Hyaloscypha bicolor E]PMD55358.1 hypothetical protein K444DRAFT_538372 [Hyaloscypha bicolor E]